MVEDLLDELAGAAWFTKLDFRFGIIKCVWQREKNSRLHLQLIKDFMSF
jgi:hypothetical protein